MHMKNEMQRHCPITDPATNGSNRRQGAGAGSQSGVRAVAAGVGLAALMATLLLVARPGQLAAQGAPPVAAARDVTINGQSVGEVDINGQPTLRIRAASGGYSPVERAQKVASRINDLSARGAMKDIHVGVLNGETVIMAGSNELVTASRQSALANATTTRSLAHDWAANLTSGLNRTYSYSGSTAYAAPKPSEHTTRKLVGIISVGTGTRVGGALVTGPSSRVSQVAAVGQLEVTYKNIVEARILVPVSNPAVQHGLHRVPEVSVYAVANYRLP
jgi:hypothetical protein